ncbi:glycosyltransferase [Thermosulfuriphilus sp.]
MITHFGDGGVERVLSNLTFGLKEVGWNVDLLVQKRGPFLEELEDSAKIIGLGEDPTKGLKEYLCSRPPQALITAKLKDDRLALGLKNLAPTCRFAILVGTVLSQRLKEGPLRRLTWRLKTRKIATLYHQADLILGVSQGVIEDLAQNFRLPRNRLRLVNNPVVMERIERMSREPAEHPWLDVPGPPVILAVGRLSAVKDFPTLIRAFKLVRERRPARLIILGEGKQRRHLEELIGSLGLNGTVSLPGFRKNPYSFMAKSHLLVLSSIREGLPTVLIEALSLGTPVVSTDCPFGPREILAGGRYGPLVPLRDPSALAQAILKIFDFPPDSEFLKEAARPYGLKEGTRSYLEALGLE